MLTSATAPYVTETLTISLRRAPIAISASLLSPFLLHSSPPPPARLFHLLSVFSAAIPQRRLRATSASLLPPSSLFLLPSLRPSRSFLLPFVPFSTKSGFAALGKSSYAFLAFFFSEEDHFRVVVDIAWIHLSMCIGVRCGCFPVFRRCWLFCRVSGISVLLRIVAVCRFWCLFSVA